MTHSFFIAGVPCTGKTWLGSWLSENESFIHIDAEKNEGIDLDNEGIHDEWNLAIQSGRSGGIAQKIKQFERPVILNWGLPLSYLYFVRSLQIAGIDTWWIDAERQPARDAFSKRGNIPMSCFDRQMNEIEKHRFILELVFKDRIIKGLNADGSQRLPIDLWQEMKTRLCNVNKPLDRTS